MKILISLSKEDAWWSSLTAKQQKLYIEEHPRSKYAKQVKTQDTKSKGLGKSLADYAKEKDDPNITAEKIYSTLKPSDAKEMKELVEKCSSLKPSNEEYKDKNGEYTPERKALHQKIIDEMLHPDKVKAATPKEGEAPAFIVLGGRGGSGKSAFTHSGDREATVKEFDSRKFITFDADEIKARLKPPYKGWNAAQVHEESSDIFDTLMAKAKAQGLNIISDATLKSDKLGPELDALKKDGYDIQGHYMFLPRQKAAQRACGRYLKDGPENRGRLVPPEVVLGNTKNEENFDKLKTYFSKWSCYDNDQPKGSPPKLIDHS
jgi:predicted ABC-type ATPase